jgi:hypothetical protein
MVFCTLHQFNLFMQRISALLFVFALLASCNLGSSDHSKSFKRFSKRFKTIYLPIEENLLYRVHNSELVSARIDTSFVQAFINPTYKLKASAPVYDGYGYTLKLPKEKGLDYHGLIHFESIGQRQFFVLNTYSLEGKLISTLPLSGDSSSYKRQTCQISEDRLIVIKDFLLHQDKQKINKQVYKIEEDGLILLENVLNQ